MKRTERMAAVLALVLAAVTLAACGKAEFGIAENTEKRMVLEAKRADEGGFVMAGELVVDDGERVVITSELKKGEIRVELVAVPAEQSIDELPDLEGEAVFRADVGPADGAAADMTAGSYMLRATCLEKATGIVRIEIEAAR